LLDDTLQGVTEIVQQGQLGGNAATSKRATIAYNALGQRTTLARFQSTGTTNAVATTDYTYDSINRLSSLTHKQGSTTLAGYTYSYDALSRPTSINTVLDGVSTFTYDSTSQLTAADHSSQVDESYGFLANGNRNTSGYTTATNNRTTAAPGFTFTYDDEGNRTSKTETATGNVTEYTWDYRNRLTTVRDRNTAGGAVVKQVDYQYDAFNRLVRRTFDIDGAGSGSATNQYWVYDGGINAVLQFDGSAASNLSHRYRWSDSVDELIANEQIGSDTLYGLGDHLGTIRDIANFNEGTGVTSVTNHRKYDSFGKLVSESNNAIDLIFGFTGKQLDEATGLQHNLFRWYDSALGQWLSEDPIGFTAGDENVRRYVGNRATYITDSSGLDWHRILLKKCLHNNGYIDENGDTTDLVTGGKLNVHNWTFAN
jgi:RHS repeat-associated protein